MEVIKETISRVMQDLDAKLKDSLPDVLDAWLRKTLSPKELKHITACSVYKGVLRLRVDSSSWIYYLNLKKEALLTNIRQQLPQVKEIRFSVSEKNEKNKSKKSQARR